MNFFFLSSIFLSFYCCCCRRSIWFSAPKNSISSHICFFFFVRFILISFSFPDYFKWNDLMQAAIARNGTSAVGLNTDHRPADAAAAVVVVLLLHFNFNFNWVKWRVLSEWAQLRLENELLSLQMNCNSSNILFFLNR